MTTPRPGTFSLDGLVEGPFPPTPGTEEKLRAWPAAAGEHGFSFSLELDGGSFSILGDPRPIRLDPDRPDRPQDVVVSLLNAFLDVLPAGARTGAFSTLRSVEYRADTKLETVYALGPEGRITEITHERPFTPAATTRLSRRAVIAAAVAVALALAALGVAWKQGWLSSLAVPAAEDFAVDVSPVAPFVEARVLEARPRALVIEIARTSSCPTDLTAFETLRARCIEENDVARWAAAEAAFRGRFTLVYRDDAGRVIQRLPVTIPGVWTAAAGRVIVERLPRSLALALEP